jgi:acetyl esterase/lipase
MTRSVNSALLLVVVLTGCQSREQNRQAASSSTVPGGQPDKKIALVDARRGFETKLIRREGAHEPLPEPPADFFRTVYYESSVGKLAAYLSPAPQDRRKHSAIIWITGGDCNTIGDVWSDAPPSNDQSARAFREAGILMMFPSLRGGNENPGFREGFLGEVDDVLAAADYLAKQKYIDPARIYLGGHSTGGTLVLLTVECSPRFRAVFSLGPVANVTRYPAQFLPFDTSNQRELDLRAPARWLHCVAAPVFVFEGTVQSNLRDLQAMARMSTNPKIHFHIVPSATHFSTIAPTTRLIASKILRDDGPTTNIAFTQKELDGLIPK